MKSRKRAFTLIELLVVIAIISLLAAIMLPALSNARELARGAACLSNQKNNGSALAIYFTDNVKYPTDYQYANGTGSSGGYIQWTAMINMSDYESNNTDQPCSFPRYSEQFVCPSHIPGGWAPTNFTTTRIPNPPAGDISQDTTNTVDDKQAPRLSYTANEALMPRKKYSAAYDLAHPTTGTQNLQQVSPDWVSQPTHTILAAEFSQYVDAIAGTSSGGGSAVKSHRPTNGVRSNQTTSGPNVFDGEGYVLGTQVYKLTIAEAQADLAYVDDSNNFAGLSLAAVCPLVSVYDHITYVDPARHLSTSNYVFADGHASKQQLSDTLDPTDYMWGRKMYSCADQPTIQDNNGSTPGSTGN